MLYNYRFFHTLSNYYSIFLVRKRVQFVNELSINRQNVLMRQVPFHSQHTEWNVHEKSSISILIYGRVNSWAIVKWFKKMKPTNLQSSVDFRYARAVQYSSHMCLEWRAFFRHQSYRQKIFPGVILMRQIWVP